MDNYQKFPLKLYVQDIFRAKRAEENRYVYEIFGRKFKNIMIHGVVTSIYNKTESATNFELSDPTGCVQVFFNTKKSNTKISQGTINDLVKSVAQKSRYGDINILTMSTLFQSIDNSYKNPVNFENSSYISVVGDIFVDCFTNTKMVCAYICKETSLERDIVWLEEIRYLYENYYLSNEGEL